MEKYHYVYVLVSLKDKKFYTGYTNNILNRLKQHNTGKVYSTRNRSPLKLIYWEGSINSKDATKREKYLKSAWGKRCLKNRLANFMKNEFISRGEYEV